MSGLTVAAIILGAVGISVFFLGIAEYIAIMDYMAWEEQARRDGTYQCCPSQSVGHMDNVTLKVVGGIGFVIGGLILYLLPRSVKDQKKSPTGAI